MEYVRKDLKDSAVEFKVTISQQEMDESRTSAIKRLGKDVKVKGFRQGRVPLDILASSINPIQLMDAQLQLAIDQAMQKIIFENDLKLLATPTVSMDKMEDGEKGLKITVKAYCLPTVKLPDFAKIKYEQVDDKVSDEEVETVINNLRNSSATKKVVSRAVKDGDEAVINFTGIHKGVEFEGGSAKNFNLVIGSKTFIPGFEEQIIGHKAGESFDIDVTFPEDYGAKNLAGEDVVFRIDLISVNEVELPELDDSFVKTWAPDLDSVDALKADIRHELQNQKDATNIEKTRENIQKAIVDKVKVDIADEVIEARAQSELDGFRSRLESMGQSLETYLDQTGKTEEEVVDKEIKPSIINAIKSQAVLQSVCAEYGVAVSEEELDARVQAEVERAQNMHRDASYLGTTEARNSIADTMLVEKYFDKIFELVGYKQK